MGPGQPAPHLAVVRPGRDGLDWLAQVVREAKTEDSLAPVTVVAPNYYAARAIVWRLAEDGGFVNVRTRLLGQVARIMAEPALGGRRALTPALDAAATRAAALRLRSSLGDVAGHRFFHRALGELFREARRSEARLESLRLEGQIGLAALDAWAAYAALCRPYADATELREIAARRLSNAAACPPELAELGMLVLYLPTRVDPVDARLVAAAARWVPVVVALGWVADPIAGGDQAAREAAAQLTGVLGCDPPTWPDTRTAVGSRTDVRIVRAPDPSEEVREVVRGIAADLEAGMPLHRVAVLYRDTETYAALVRDSLTLAGLPWSALEGVRLADTLPGRALSALLRLPERRFERTAVLRWIDACGQVQADGPDLEPGAWDRVTRAANVVRGAKQWVERLTRYAATCEDSAAQQEQEGMVAVAAGLRREGSAARAMAKTIGDLDVALRPPESGSTWASFVGWAQRLMERFGQPRGGWPDRLSPTVDRIAAAIGDLAQADEFRRDVGPTLAEFLDALEAALDGETEQAGHFGDGVVVGPIPSVTGLAFERVYVVGLVEGTLPPTPAPDPFGDPMGLVDRRRAEERRAFLVAVACADGGRLVLSTPDSTGGRPAYPSRWLLEVAAGLEGRSSLATSEFRRLRNGDSRPWLRVVLSAQNGVERASAAADLEDRRLAEAIAVVRSGQLARHPLALREDLPLGRGLASIRARRSSAFTAFDGNLIDRAADSRRLSGTSTGNQPTSATAIEQWATCPFRYFLSHVLRVEPTRRPEESWSLDPLERGTLIHEILCLFMREQVQRGGPPAVYGDDDIALIESIAGSSFTERERSGVTGHPLVWSTVRSAIVAELRAFLARDQAWREANNCHPWRFEQAFGTPASASWPEVEIPVGDASMRFRGVIDRVDRAADGSRAYVVDYKTGDSKSYESIRDDPVLGGQHLQLALYTQAVRDEAGAPVPAAGCFWFTSRGSRVTHAAIPDDPDAVRRRLKEALEQVATGIGQGAFPQVPGAEASTSFANCRYCDFVRVCPSAVDDVWARKRLSPAHQLHSRLALGHQELGDEEESD